MPNYDITVSHLCAIMVRNSFVSIAIRSHFEIRSTWELKQLNAKTYVCVQISQVMIKQCYIFSLSRQKNEHFESSNVWFYVCHILIRCSIVFKCWSRRMCITCSWYTCLPRVWSCFVHKVLFSLSVIFTIVPSRAWFFLFSCFPFYISLIALCVSVLLISSSLMYVTGEWVLSIRLRVVRSHRRCLVRFYTRYMRG